MIELCPASQHNKSLKTTCFVQYCRNSETTHGITDKTKIGLWSLNKDKLFHQVVNSVINENLTNLNSALKRCVENWTFWNLMLEKMFEKKKTKVNLKRLGKIFYQKQKYAPGRLSIVQILKKSNTSTDSINFYIREAEGKFGKLKDGSGTISNLVSPESNQEVSKNELKPDKTNKGKNFIIESDSESDIPLPMSKRKNPDIHSTNDNQEINQEQNLNSTHENHNINSTDKSFDISSTVNSDTSCTKSPKSKLSDSSSSASIVSTSSVSTGIYIPKFVTEKAPARKSVKSESDYQPESTSNGSVSSSDSDFITPRNNKSKNIGNHDISNGSRKHTKPTEPNADPTLIKDKNDEHVNSASFKQPQKHETVLPQMKVSTETLANVLNVHASDLNYQPAVHYSAIIPAESIKADSIDWSTGQFRLGGNYPKLIDQAMQDAGSVCSFNSSRPPRQYSQKFKNESSIKGWCVFHGHCGGNCQQQFDVVCLKRPQKGEDVKLEIRPYGVFHLVQRRGTGRQLRGSERVKVKAILENKKAHAVFMENMSHIEGLRALHRNLPQKSAGALRKAKSEISTSRRTHPDPEIDLKNLISEMKQETNNAQKFKGFVQEDETRADRFHLWLYSEAALDFHADQLKSGLVTCYADSTGGIIRKLEIEKEEAESPSGCIVRKQPFLYNLVCKNVRDITYPLAQNVSLRGRVVDLRAFFDRLEADFRVVRTLSGKPFAHLIVCDWCYALIGSITAGNVI